MSARDIVMAAAGASKVAPDPVPIGQPYGGGFYAGQISTTGNGIATHYLIVSPKSSGESAKQWKTTATSTSGTDSFIDGAYNSANMNNTNHPAAYFCKGLTIGGYSDWYLPAHYELEICYYNLKPTTAGNTLASMQNIYAVPPRNSNYTSNDPAQTSATAFQSGGTEAFNAAYYWSSTEASATLAWNKTFLYGGSGNNDVNKAAYYHYVRAIRRVPV